MLQKLLILITIIILAILWRVPSIASAQPVAANEINQWTGEYYDSIDIDGLPLFIRTDMAIAFNWGIGSPVSSIPANNFGVHWTSTTYFERGTYQFFVLVDEKVLVTLDGETIIDTLETSQEGETLRYTADLSEGEHTLSVLYIEQTGEAYIYVAWNKLLDLSLVDGEGNLTYYVESEQLNVRSGPGGGYEILTTELEGATLRLTGRSADNAWLQVVLADATVGWVNSAFLTSGPVISTLPIIDISSTPTLLYMVNTEQLNLRTGPGVRYDAIDILLEGATVSAIGRNADRLWLEVELSDGRIGWVNAFYLEISVQSGR